MVVGIMVVITAAAVVAAHATVQGRGVPLQGSAAAAVAAAVMMAVG